LLVVVLASFSTPLGARHAQADEHDESYAGRALLISSATYDADDFSDLSYVDKDVDALKDTLERWYKFKVEECRDQNHKEMRKRIGKWLDSLNGPESTKMALLYFTGHGAQGGGTGDLRLVAKDTKLNDLETTAVSGKWVLDRLAQCNADSKVLILDSCHAGTQNKGPNQPKFRWAKSMEIVFKETKGVTTLASCSEEQNSYEWKSKGMSLFTYWLHQGLRGHADSMSGLNREVTLPELEHYLREKVHETAKRIGKEQTPQRLSRNVENPAVFRIIHHPSLSETIEGMAEQLSVPIHLEKGNNEKILRVGFFQRTDADTQGFAGNLPALVGRKLEEELRKRGSIRKGGEDRVLYEVCSLRDQEEVTYTNFRDKFDAGLVQGGKNVDMAVRSQCKDRHRDFVRLEAELYQPKRDLAVTSVNLEAKLTEEDKQDVENTWKPPPIFHTKPSGDGQPPLVPFGSESPEDYFNLCEVVIYAKAGGGNKWKRHTVKWNGDWFAVDPPLEKDDVYRIHLINKSRTLYFARVLVDARSPYPGKGEKRDKTKSVNDLPATRIGDARPCVLDPTKGHSLPDGGKEWCLEGFYTQVGAVAPASKFLVGEVNVPPALRKVDAPLGIITVAFYEGKLKEDADVPPPPPVTRGLGTVFGGSITGNVPQYDGNQEPVNNALYNIKIRYAR